MTRQNQDQQSRVFFQLSDLVLNLLRSPPSPIPFSDDSTVMPPTVSSSRPRPRPVPAAEISPSGFALLMLGISLALMLCGSVTFFIGFMLMPWVLGLVMVFCAVGMVSSLSEFGRSILYSATPRKQIPAWKLL